MCIRLYIITHLVALQFIYAQKCFKDDSTNLKITLSLSLLFVHAKKHNQTQRFQSFLEGIFSTFHKIIQSALCDKQRLSREILRQYNVEINKKRFLKIQTNHRERSSKFFKKIQYPFIVTSSSLQKLYWYWSYLFRNGFPAPTLELVKNKSRTESSRPLRSPFLLEAPGNMRSASDLGSRRCN